MQQTHHQSTRQKLYERQNFVSTIFTAKDIAQLDAKSSILVIADLSAGLGQPKLREVLDQYRRDDEEAKNAWWEKVNEISSDSKAQAGLWHKYKSKKCTKNRYADRLKPSELLCLQSQSMSLLLVLVVRTSLFR